MVRYVLDMVICMVLCWLLISTFLLEAFIVPSGSMAYTLLGSHFDFTCSDCQQRFSVGYEESERDYFASCPNCGKRQRLSEGGSPLTQGDRLLVFKQSYSLANPRRWEIAVFKRPGIASLNYVKRIVGLPGESIQVNHGNVYVNGKIARKTLQQQRALAITVHDSHFPSSETPERWKSDNLVTHWKKIGQQHLFPDTGQAKTDHPALTDWLTYHHWERLNTDWQGFNGETPILDYHGYNLATSRSASQMNFVSEVMLTCKLMTGGSGDLFLRLQNGNNQFEVQLDPSTGKGKLLHNRKDVLQFSTESPILQEFSKVEFSMIDNQIILAINGNQLFPPYEFDILQRSALPVTRPASIGSRGLGITVTDLKIWRDVYYTNPLADHHHRPTFGTEWAISEPYQLADDEYFVLGDNTVNSDDSRTWFEGPGIPEKLLVGRPLVVHWPSVWVKRFNRMFEIPDLPKMRFLR